MPFDDVIEQGERRSKAIKYFHSGSPDTLHNFDTDAVHFERFELPAAGSDGFVLLYEDDEYACALPLETFETLADPPLAPPWEPAAEREPLTQLLERLDDTPFDEYDRRQMLATSRAIEERAWRYGYGTVFAGFQSVEALEPQVPIYAELASRTELSFELYVADRVDDLEINGASVHEMIDSDLDRYWFVLYDAGGDATNKCGLLAEERSPDAFSGFWTQDPARVDAIISYLEAFE